MRQTGSYIANQSPIQTPHPNPGTVELDPIEESQPLVEPPDTLVVSNDSGMRTAEGPTQPIKMATIESRHESTRMIENSQVQLPKKYDQNVFTVVNQKAAMKKRVTTDLDLVIYIDGARFLPDNVNITKLKVSFYNRDGKVIGNESEHTKMMTEHSDVYNPTYELKIKLSKDEYELTEGVWMFCSLYTLEISHHNDYTTSVFFAYTVLPLAITEKEGKDPFVWGFKRLVLNHGAFQLPLYSPRQSRETIEETILAIE